jgi:hypothetical protein
MAPQDYVQYAPFEHLVPTYRAIAATRISESVKTDVRLFLSVYGEFLAVPAVTASPDGGVQLEWYLHGVGVEMLFDNEGDLVVLIDRNGAIESELARGLRDPFLLNALQYIRRA